MHAQKRVMFISNNQQSQREIDLGGSWRWDHSGEFGTFP